MKNLAILSILWLALLSAPLKAQHDSSAVKHPKINLKYSYRYRVKYGIHYKDSALYGYYFGTDSSYAWSFSKSGSDPVMALFMKDDKPAYRLLKKIHTITIFEAIPKGISFIGYGGVIITGYTAAAVSPLIGFVALGISCGVLGTGLGLVAICEHAKKKSFLKGVSMYNHDYGYL
jgi:hypothetical protein